MNKINKMKNKYKFNGSLSAEDCKWLIFYGHNKDKTVVINEDVGQLDYALTQMFIMMKEGTFFDADRLENLFWERVTALANYRFRPSINLLHTKKDAEYCLWYFKKYICKEAELIGAFGKGKTESEHDIDIYIPNKKFTGEAMAGFSRRVGYKNKIQVLINAESSEETDWGGLFFHNSVFGNVDVFFDISKFDY